jgi:hypothetical protein
MQIALLEQNEEKLKAEVGIYSGKYQGFQDAFKKFQTEMTDVRILFPVVFFFFNCELVKTARAFQEF